MVKWSKYNCFMLWLLPVLLILQSISSAQSTTTSNKTAIHVAAFLPFNSSRLSYLGLDQIESVKKALVDINNKENMLQNYELKVIFYYTELDPATAVDDFIHMVAEKPLKYGIVGLIASAVSEVLCLTTKNWNVATISSSSVSVTMNNPDKYPYFYRTTLSDASYIEAQIAVIKHFQWNNVAVVYETSSTYSPTASLLIERLQKNNVTVTSSLGVLQLYDHAIENLKAYRNGLYGQRYIWFIPGFFPEKWYFVKESEANEVNCTTEEIFQVLKNYFTAYRYFNRAENVTKTISGKTTWEIYQSFYANPNLTRIHDHLKAYTYDAMWTLALALNATNAELKNRNQSLLDFNYVNNDIMNIINQKILDSSFQGLSGHVSYKKRERVEEVHILQLNGNMSTGEMVSVGIYDFRSETLQFNNTNHIIWPAGKPIKSPPIIVVNKILVSSTAIIIFSSLAGVGIFSAVGFLLFNLIHRKNRSIRLSSPHLNSIFAVGCILCYLDVITLGLNTDNSGVTLDNFGFLCGAQIWLLSYGFTLAFGSLFAKTWRVYRIFTNKTTKTIAIKDWHLITTVANLLIVDIIIFIIWTAVDRLEGIVKTISTDNDPHDPDRRIQLDLQYCTCQNIAVWLGILCGYKFLLLIFGSFLAFETRKVNMKILNDSKFIGFSIYNVSVFCLLGVLSSVAIGNQETLNYCLRSACIIICTTITMFMVFLPKILVWKDGKSYIEPSAHFMSTSTTALHRDLQNDGNVVSQYLQLSDLNKFQTMLQQKYKTYHKLHQELITLQDVVNELKRRYQCTHS